MAYKSDDLMKEREAIMMQLRDWWRRYTEWFRETIGEGDPGLVLMPLDDWARETPEQTANRAAMGRTPATEQR